ncbi:hypothetical protein C8R41DRAFT_50281 [Lentinula lateritia]|uniref:Uncharacterized protein n=1 Tax=Lentinula lateritia TaxID=40482 RepID=A0ABQ8V011_9AGAR|nr:hypothetical protein C8R41DRAFT_50281 [Lentinula lateritia]
MLVTLPTSASYVPNMTIIEDIYKRCPRRDPTEATEDLKAASEDYPKGKALSKELQLDRKRLKDDSYLSPRKLFYGFGVDIQDFIDYHQRYNLPRPPPEDDRSLLWLYMMDQVLEDLKKTCHFYRFKRELAISVEHRYILAIYDSYTFDHGEMDNDTEQRIYGELRERMDVCKNQEPRWFRPFPDIYD